MKWLIKTLIAIVIIGLIGLVTYKFVFNKDVANTKNKKEDFLLQASSLIKEASANDSLTKTKYLNKLLAVTGNVKEVIANDSAMVINLGDSTSASTIKCQIDARNNNAAKNVKINTIITIKGRLAGIINNSNDPLFEGMDLGTDIVLNYCNIEN